MLVLGLTGSIAAGKSTVSRMLRELGAVIIDADVIARRIVEPGERGNALVREAFGDGVFLPDGRLDRRALGERVFGDEPARRKLNAILHPIIGEECYRLAKEAGEKDPGCIAVIDAPLLIEAGMHGRVDAVVLVTADDDLRLRRILGRDALDPEQAARRMASQMPQDEKRRYADYVIDNSGSEGDTREQVVSLYERLKGEARMHAGHSARAPE